jgi:hypothetical protein
LPNKTQQLLDDPTTFEQNAIGPPRQHIFAWSSAEAKYKAIGKAPTISTS